MYLVDVTKYVSFGVSMTCTKYLYSGLVLLEIRC